MARKHEDSEVELTALQPAASRKKSEAIQGSQDIDERALITRVYWGLLPWMFVTGLFTYFDRANFSFAAPALRHDLGLSNAAYGLASGESICDIMTICSLACVLHLHTPFRCAMGMPLSPQPTSVRGQQAGLR